MSSGSTGSSLSYFTSNTAPGQFILGRQHSSLEDVGFCHPYGRPRWSSEILVMRLQRLFLLGLAKLIMAVLWKIDCRK